MKYIGRILLLLIASLLLHDAGAQTACPSISAGNNDTIPCGTLCTTLHASVFPSGSTTSYAVSQIPYAPMPFNMGLQPFIHKDDQFSDTINLPFNFCFFGNVYSHVLVGANEIISFNYGNALRYNNFSITDSVPSGNIPFDIQNSVMCPWQDIDPTLAGSVYYQIVGTAPCRMFIATWDSVPYFGSLGSRDSTICPTQLLATSQVILYETTNVIDINIQMKGICPSWNGGNAIEGILNDSGTIAYTVPGRNATQWTAQNDAWRFTPNGSPADYTVSWYQGGTLVGTGDSITVCPSANLQTTYTAQATINPCGGGTPVVVADSVVVSLTGTLVAGIDSSKNLLCYNGHSGEAWAHSSGGAIPVNLDWWNVTTGATLGGTFNQGDLNPGTYAFTVKDNNGCIRSDTVVITGPTQQDILLLSILPTGCAGNTGTITVMDTGGTPGYQYLWSNGVAGVVDTALAQGQYSVTATDANSCTVTESYDVTQTSSVITSCIPHNPQCAQSDDGSIEANPAGGTPPYFFTWSNNDNKQIAGDLAPGNYSCTVTDQFGCSASCSEIISAPLPLQMSVTSAAVKCIGDDNGVIIASPSGGTLPYYLSATPDGVNFTSDSDGIMDGLAPGSYKVILADANGCILTYNIAVPNASPDFFDVTVDSALCFGYNDGAAQIVDSSQQNRPYQYSIDSTEQFQFASDFNNLSPGNHTITAINKNGCVSTVPLFIPQPGPIIAGVSPDTVTLELGQNQQVAVTYLNASGIISFNWSPDLGLSCMDCPDPTVGPYTSQNYTVTVSALNQNASESATCYGYANLSVTVLANQPFFIPNSFTPNGDGVNDLFEIYGESIKTVDLRIFNRWGEMVFQTQNQFDGWDGTYKGQLQQPGVFTYNAVITFLDNTQQTKSGSVTLLR